MALHYNLKNVPTSVWKLDVPKEEYESLVKEKEKDKKGVKVNFLDLNQINIDGNKYWRLNPVTNMLIFACGLTVGISHISKDNFLKVYNRISIWEKVFGNFINVSVQESESVKKTTVPRYFTLEDIKSHIGLSIEVTNRFEAVLTKKDFLEKFNKELDKIDL